MSIQEEKLAAIADAIREKDGSTEEIAADDFPDRIRAISPGVKSFNGRTGDVMPATGDYTAAQVGALSLSGGTLTGAVTINTLNTFLKSKIGAQGISLSKYFKVGALSGEAIQASLTDIHPNPTEDSRIWVSGIADPIYDADAANKAYVDSKASGIPSGVIVMWSGAANAIPTGWALCDGTNNTPDLRNRFIVGAGSTYAVGATGGSDTVTLTVEQMPVHTHNYDVSVSGYESVIGGGGIYLSKAFQNTPQTGIAGGGGSHENRPPYYALCFIMKI